MSIEAAFGRPAEADGGHSHSVRRMRTSIPSPNGRPQVAPTVHRRGQQAVGPTPYHLAVWVLIRAQMGMRGGKGRIFSGSTTHFLYFFAADINYS